ncbi:MAG: hypothetical protein WCH44_03405 [Betaproteobacteria bacterium]
MLIAMKNLESSEITGIDRPVLSCSESLSRHAQFAESLIGSRQNISPKRLIEPGPNPRQLAQIFCAAAAAPDHGLLTPFVVDLRENERQCVWRKS